MMIIKKINIKHGGKNKREIDMFLNKLNWKTNTGTLNQCISFQIDVYKFVFDTPLEDKCFTEFTAFIKELNMTKLRSVLQIFVWLYQHEIKFKLIFGYNPGRSFKYNIKNIFEPKRNSKLLLSYGHEELTACPIDIIGQKKKIDFVG